MTDIRLGTRGSQLARRQSATVAALLEAAGHHVELVTIVTAGDTRAPDTAWGEGAFVGALERALEDGTVDIAVHSAKDVPLDTALPIAAYPLRADARDALVGRNAGATLATLLPRAVVGTDSPRRTGFLRAARRDLVVIPLHGNVDTRLRRLDDGEVDALVLATAGLERLDRADRIGERLDVSLLPPAPGQGALAVQVRANAPAIERAVAAIDDASVRSAVETERAVLRASGGGCRAPIGASARVEGSSVRLIAGIVEPSGDGRLVVDRSMPAGSAADVAGEIAAAFRAAGHRPEAVA